MTAIPEEKLHTIEEIENLPEGTRAELIDGDIYYMAAPSVIHQRIVMQLSAAIAYHIRSHKGTCEVFPAPFAVYLFDIQDDTNYIEPDITVICDPGKTANGKGCDGAPDFIVEIVSPSTANRDYLLKLERYRAAGVKEYWIVNPDREAVNVYGFESGISGLYLFSDRIPCAAFPGLEICLKELLQ